MLSKFKVIENSIFYTISTVLVKGMGFLLMPIYTYFLTPDEYGAVNLITGFNQVAIFLVGFSLYSAIVRFYAEYKDEKETLNKFYGTIITFIAISNFVFIAIFYLLRNIFMNLFFENLSFFPLIFIGLINLAFLSYHTVYTNILQSSQKGRKLTIVNLLIFVLQSLLTLLFIGVIKIGALGMLLATVLGFMIFSIYISYDIFVKNQVKLCLDKRMLITALRYSLPLLPHNLSTHIANFASRIFINTSSNLAVVGVYGIATQFGTIVDTIQTSVNRAFTPWFFEKMKIGIVNSKDEIRNLTKGLLVLYTLVYLIIGLFAQEVIVLFVNDRYLESWKIVPIMVMGYSVKSIYYFYVNVLFYDFLASRRIFIATLTGSALNICLSYYMIPTIGMYGAALSFFFSKVYIVMVVVYISSRYLDVGYKFYELIKIVIISWIFMGIGLMLSYNKYTFEMSKLHNLKLLK